MIFTHDTQTALQAAAALVNTLPRDGEEDTLTTIRDLDAFVRETGWTGSRARDAAELDAVRRLRPRLRELWDLAARRTPDRLIKEVNTILREAGAVPQLVDHDDYGWHIHAVPSAAPLATRMAVEAAMALVDVIRAGELERLRTCDADDCDDVLVDLSRNRSRRFCEGGCGNRINVRAYRERQTTD